MGNENVRQAQFDQAMAEYRVVLQGANPSSAYVEAEAGTGSRYAVVISKLPYPAVAREGGDHLVSVLQPIQSNMVFSTFPGEEIHLDYLVEKLIARNRPNGMSGGDIAGIWKTVNQAIDVFHRATGYAQAQADAAAVRNADR